MHWSGKGLVCHITIAWEKKTSVWTGEDRQRFTTVGLGWIREAALCWVEARGLVHVGRCWSVCSWARWKSTRVASCYVGISQFCIVFTFWTGLVIKITNVLLWFYYMVNFNKGRDSNGRRHPAHCGFGVKHLVGQAVGEAAKRLHLRLLRRHDRRCLCFSLFQWHLLGCIWNWFFFFGIFAFRIYETQEWPPES